MKYMIVIERESTSWGAYVPDLPVCAAADETREDVVRLIKEAIEFHIEGLKQDGAPIPQPTSEMEYVDVTVA
ncbi:MAG: type II toxin-antitoxin system HicB family antitoxin [Candidatus Coatesbacteria bacterium]|nr:type II toxin-antitoxin system HicB family antitoxin [Candidatus Coatesbacteria bacterium]